MNTQNRFHLRWVIVAALAAALGLFSSCKQLTMSIGAEDTIIIMASREDQLHLEPLMTNIFGRELATPAPEPAYKIKWAYPEEFEKFQHFKNVVVASLISPADSTGDYLMRTLLGSERMDEIYAGGNPVFITKNFYARDQIFMAFTARDAIHARQELGRSGEWIFDQFDAMSRDRLLKRTYRYGENSELADELQEKYGWRMKIQKDYVLVKEKPEDNFVWFGRGYPYRWLSVHWIDDANSIAITSDWAWDKMAFVAEELYATIFIDTLFRSNHAIEVNGREVRVQRGVWAHKKEPAGGPFMTYIFRDREARRIYFVNGLVHNPGRNKVVMMRRIEGIARTLDVLAATEE